MEIWNRKFDWPVGHQRTGLLSSEYLLKPPYRVGCVRPQYSGQLCLCQSAPAVCSDAAHFTWTRNSPFERMRDLNGGSAILVRGTARYGYSYGGDSKCSESLLMDLKPFRSSFWFEDHKTGLDTLCRMMK